MLVAINRETVVESIGQIDASFTLEVDAFREVAADYADAADSVICAI